MGWHWPSDAGSRLAEDLEKEGARIIVTAHAKDEMGREDLEDIMENRVMSGPGIYLEKPVSPTAYVRAVRRALGIEEKPGVAGKLDLKEEIEKSLHDAGPDALRRALEALRGAGKT